MMWAFTMEANSSWWSGLRSHCCLLVGRELRALSVGHNMVNGLWTCISRTGIKPAACSTNHKQTTGAARPAPSERLVACGGKLWWWLAARWQFYLHQFVEASVTVRLDGCREVHLDGRGRRE